MSKSTATPGPWRIWRSLKRLETESNNPRMWRRHSRHSTIDDLHGSIVARVSVEATSGPEQQAAHTDLIAALANDAMPIIEALQKQIQDAPHASSCETSYRAYMSCTCWKSNGGER